MDTVHQQNAQHVMDLNKEIENLTHTIHYLSSAIRDIQYARGYMRLTNANPFLTELENLLCKVIKYEADLAISAITINRERDEAARKI